MVNNYMLLKEHFDAQCTVAQNRIWECMFCSYSQKNALKNNVSQKFWLTIGWTRGGYWGRTRAELRILPPRGSHCTACTVRESVLGQISRRQPKTIDVCHASMGCSLSRRRPASFSGLSTDCPKDGDRRRRRCTTFVAICHPLPFAARGTTASQCVLCACCAATAQPEQCRRRSLWHSAFAFSVTALLSLRPHGHRRRPFVERLPQRLLQPWGPRCRTLSLCGRGAAAVASCGCGAARGVRALHLDGERSRCAPPSAPTHFGCTLSHCGYTVLHLRYTVLHCVGVHCISRWVQCMTLCSACATLQIRFSLTPVTLRLHCLTFRVNWSALRLPCVSLGLHCVVVQFHFSCTSLTL